MTLTDVKIAPADVIQNSKFKIQKHHLILLALTAIAAIIRFSVLSRPTLWFDEVATYVRVCGTYQQFLDVHRRDAFVPLHYEMYWVLGKIVKLTPTMMRVIPALAGTLMVPAIYFLARQMCSRRTALVSAAFAATSAYLINFSRDAKMYMHFWLFCTLCMASLMWWLRTGRRVAWLAWVASGAAMLGLQLTGFIVVGLMPVVLLTRGRRRAVGGSDTPVRHPATHSSTDTFRKSYSPRSTASDVGQECPTYQYAGARILSASLNELRIIGLFLLGVIIMSSGATGHFWGFSRWSDPGREVGPNVQFKEYVKDLEIPGISWIPMVNRGRGGADMIAQAGTAFLFAFEWPRVDELERISPRVMQAMTLAAWIMLTLLVTAAFPWPREWMSRDPSACEPWWRAMLWIAMWIIVPTYAFYCASLRGFESPGRLISSLGELRGGIFVALGAFVIATAVMILFWTIHGKDFAIDVLKSRGIRLAQLLLVVVGILLICTVIAYAAAQRDSQSVWVPRYIGFIWPAIAIACAALLMRLPTWPIRWLAVGIFILINLAHAFARLTYNVEPRVDKVAADVWSAQDLRGPLRTYANVQYGPPAPGGGTVLNLVGKYYLGLESGKRLSPSAFRTRGDDDEVGQIRVRQGGDFLMLMDLNSAKQVNRAIVWDQIDETRGEIPDTLTAKLPPGWKLVHDDRFTTWERWTWQYMHTLRRREYVRS